MTEEKDKGGRPSKIGKFIEVLEKVLNEDSSELDKMNAVVATDEELIMLVNESLDEEDRISDSTFERWKANDIKDERCQVFRGLYKKALLKQKQTLFKKFGDEKGSWQKWAWILERKFDSWNLKHKEESKVDLKTQPTTVVITRVSPKPKAKMNMYKVKSTNIKQIGYNVDSKKMRVRFKDGSAYDYHAVSEDVFDDCLKAKSKGKYLKEKIKGVYTHTKINNKNAN